MTLELVIKISMGLLGYIMGNFSMGDFLAKKEGIDLSNVGSGNSGATNALRAGGVKMGVSTLLGDAFKALVPMVIIRGISFLVGSDKGLEISLLFGLFCVIGHDFPIIKKFKGGKGASTTLGLCLGLYPLLVPIGALAFILVVLVTRYVSLGSIIGVTFMSILIIGYSIGTYGFVDLSLKIMVSMSIVIILVFFTHRENIKRIISGTERKLGKNEE